MRVAVVGIGIIGRAMAESLLAAGHEVAVYNRSAGRTDDLVAAGARAAGTPGDAAREAAVVITAVTDPVAVDAVCFGPHGILAALGPDAVHCDMGTVTPESARRVYEAYRAAGRRFVQAPILGSKRQIAKRTLLVFAGGAEGDVERCLPAWEAFMGRLWRFPAADQAAAAKLACNMLIAHMILGLGQSLIFAKQAGAAPETLLDILGASALGCGMYASKGKTLTERDFAANFVVRNMLKDLTLACEAARAVGAPAPFAALARELFVAADQQGFGQQDYSAVVKVLEGLAACSLGPVRHDPAGPPQ